MAVFTPVSDSDLAKIVDAHGLPMPDSVAGIAAGSVNSNFRLQFAKNTLFLRVYEEQGADGVAWEWSLLPHLADRGVPVPERLVPTEDVTVRGKPVALFGWVTGDECCQKGVTEDRMRAVGTLLGKIHAASDGMPPKPSRFRLAQMAERFSVIEKTGRQEHLDVLPRLEANVAELGAWPNVQALPGGVTHGDLFRDNVRWSSSTQISCVLDWDSASTGTFIYDVAVTALAWCYGDTLELPLVRAFLQGYQTERALTSDEWARLHDAFRAAATRFTISRITDYALRQGLGDRVVKDWRRFLWRLDTVERTEAKTWVAQLRDFL